LIITVTILHEISHSFTGHYFNQLFTPLGIGIGPQMSKHGESGWLAEERLFAGRFLIYWNDEKEEGNLATIDDVVLSDGSGSWVIGESSQWCWLYDGADFSEDVNVATKLLSSLQSPKLDWPARCTLTPYLPTSGSARAY
jgi:hypothetical protein